MAECMTTFALPKLIVLLIAFSASVIMLICLTEGVIDKSWLDNNFHYVIFGLFVVVGFISYWIGKNWNNWKVI